ncbi:methyltransferase domain-containing protein [Bradyrhizobium sp. CSA112]|uniref:class I SAM-dependent methyltransferase n=1 Tax=Bradyrhizobium sp. CSA112 TaxID=2699170 RepID=UPI0023B12CB5|nr:class I SAM-dependent methyltransferase [Bradyrhizobium sp. CSA112]MDE5454585.1 methyltransferase domain-containing protein [Bradyrhizobium sp. CSA112]
MSLVREFYKDAQKEWDRLDIPLCQIEFASTLALIDAYLTGRKEKVADIGGGPGRYTIELLKRGCHATLFDLSPENIALAETKVAELGLQAERYLVGDARDLSALRSQQFDGILALGPLYHLTAREERIAFLQAARQLLKPDGIVIAAYLNAWGIARTLLTDAPAWFADSFNVAALLTGAEFVGARACSGFTECHWSNPDHARKEMQEAGFVILEEIGAEGFASGARNEIAAIANNNPSIFEKIIDFGVLTGKLPQYRHATDHLLLVGRS